MGPTDLSIELPVINVYVRNPCTCKKASRFDDKKIQTRDIQGRKPRRESSQEKRKGKKIKKNISKTFCFLPVDISEEEISSVKDFLKKSDEDGPQSNSL